MRPSHMIVAILAGIAGATLIVSINEITNDYVIFVLYTCITWCSIATMEVFTE